MLKTCFYRHAFQVCHCLFRAAQWNKTEPFKVIVKMFYESQHEIKMSLIKFLTVSDSLLHGILLLSSFYDQINKNWSNQVAWHFFFLIWCVYMHWFSSVRTNPIWFQILKILFTWTINVAIGFTYSFTCAFHVGLSLCMCKKVFFTQIEHIVEFKHLQAYFFPVSRIISCLLFHSDQAQSDQLRCLHELFSVQLCH